MRITGVNLPPSIPSADRGIEPDTTTEPDLERHQIVTFDSRASVKHLKSSANVSKMLERLNQTKPDD